MRRRHAVALLFFASLSMLIACASHPLAGIEKPAIAQTWPPGKGDTRIELLFAYSGTNRAQAGRDFLSRVGDFFVGSETFEFVSPYGMAGSMKDRLFVADPGQGVVHIIDFGQQTHSLLGDSEEAPFATPVDVALASNGHVYVTDSSLACVHHFDGKGRRLPSFGNAAELGRPTGIAYDALQERLLIVDTSGGRLLSYNLEGHLQQVSGMRGSDAGHFNYPTNVAVGADGRITIVDSMNFRVQTLNSKLEAESAFGLAGDGPGTFARPKGVALDSDGHIYVVDAMFDNVQIFNRQGELLLTFATRGNQLGQLYLPSGILIDDENHIIVADAGNSRLQVFKYHHE